MSILKSLLESEIAVRDNTKINSAINELAAIQEKGDYLPQKIKYTAESAPVFKQSQNGKTLFIIECDNLCKLMDSMNWGELDALNAVKSVLTSDDPDVKFDDMALLVKDENIEQIEEICNADKSKAGARTEQIMSYSKFLKNVISEGVNILVDRK